MDEYEEHRLVGLVKSRFMDSETGRRPDEERWLKAYKNYRGIYDSTTQYRDNERSKVFIKITKTKVLAAYGQIVDMFLKALLNLLIFHNNHNNQKTLTVFPATAKSFYREQRKQLLLLV